MRFPEANGAAAPGFTLPFVAVVLAGGSAAWRLSLTCCGRLGRARPTPLDAPAIPVTVAGVLFDVPPAAIREAVQRHPGQHERIDLAFEWPSLTPPNAGRQIGRQAAARMPRTPSAAAAASRERTAVRHHRRLGRGAAAARTAAHHLSALRRSRRPTAGPDGLAILPFRAGTPYEGEDLVYVGDQSRAVFRPLHARGAQRCPAPASRSACSTRPQITLRFPRDWLGDWRNVACRLRPAGGADCIPADEVTTCRHQSRAFAAIPDRWRGSPSGNCRSARRPRRRRTARR